MQGKGSNFIQDLLDISGRPTLVSFISHPTQFQWCYIRWAYWPLHVVDSISRMSWTKYILSWSEGVLTQNVHIIAQVHGYMNLHQLTKMTKASAAPEHNALSGSVIATQSTAGWVSLVGIPPDKHPPITLYNGHLELIAEEDLAQWLLNVHCPVLNHLDERTPILGWCRTRRPSRTGLVLFRACFT